jgi:hypothetical protein
MGNVHKSESEGEAKRIKTATERNDEWRVCYTVLVVTIPKDLVREEREKLRSGLNSENFKSALAGENVEKNRYQSVLARKTFSLYSWGMACLRASRKRASIQDRRGSCGA